MNSKQFQQFYLNFLPNNTHQFPQNLSKLQNNPKQLLITYKFPIYKLDIKKSNMSDPSQTTQGSQFDQQPFLRRELQKFLHIHSDQDDNRIHTIFSLLGASQQIFNQIDQLRFLCQRIKVSLQSNNKAIINQNIPKLIIKDVLNIRNINEIDISKVSNKLKSLVCKSLQKQSSKLRYNYNSYISQSLEQINDFRFVKKYQKMKQQFMEIRKKYTVIKQSIVLMYRYHLTNVFKFCHADFFVSFYLQSLLFFQDQPIYFNGNLLFVPILLTSTKNKQSGKIIHTQIHSWYIKQLYKQNNNWQFSCLQIIIWNISKNKIKHYSWISFQKKGHENQTCALLRKIRCYVYFMLLFNYLNHTLVHQSIASNNKSIQLALNQKYLLQINITKQINDNTIDIDHRITRDVLKYFDEQNIRKRNQINRYQVTNNLQNYLLCLIANYKYGCNFPQQYIKLKPKYIYVQQKRFSI